MAVIRRDYYGDEAVKPTDFIGEYRASQKATQDRKNKLEDFTAQQNVISKNREAEKKNAVGQSLYQKKKEASLNFHMDKIRQKNGLPIKGAGRVGSALSARQTSVGGYKSLDEVPKDANGVPLNSVRMDTKTGTYVPTYKNKTEPAGMAVAKYKQDMVEQERTYNEQNPKFKDHPMQAIGKGFQNLIGRVQNSNIGQSIGKAIYDRENDGNIDYNSLSEGMLAQLAKKGDAKAYTLGKRKFAK